MKKLFTYGGLAMAASILLAGCSSTPSTVATAQPVQSSRIYLPELVKGTGHPSDATVVFLRDGGFIGSGCSHDIFVNNRKAFAMRQGEQQSLRLPPGDYFFRLETGGGLCPNVSTSQETVLKEGTRQVYRILLPSDGSLRLTRQE